MKRINRTWIFRLLIFILSAFTCFSISFLIAQQVQIPKFTISIDYSSRSSSYDYRIVDENHKSYLEMRQTGKKKWAIVEEVTCKDTGRFESESFDSVVICK